MLLISPSQRPLSTTVMESSVYPRVSPSSISVFVTCAQFSSLGFPTCSQYHAFGRHLFLSLLKSHNHKLYICYMNACVLFHNFSAKYASYFTHAALNIPSLFLQSLSKTRMPLCILQPVTFPHKLPLTSHTRHSPHQLPRHPRMDPSRPPLLLKCNSSPTYLLSITPSFPGWLFRPSVSKNS